jgi:hypothetical protein
MIVVIMRRELEKGTGEGNWRRELEKETGEGNWGSRKTTSFIVWIFDMHIPEVNIQQIAVILQPTRL